MKNFFVAVCSIVIAVCSGAEFVDPRLHIEIGPHVVTPQEKVAKATGLPLELTKGPSLRSHLAKYSDPIGKLVKKWVGRLHSMKGRMKSDERDEALDRLGEMLGGEGPFAESKRAFSALLAAIASPQNLQGVLDMLGTHGRPEKGDLDYSTKSGRRIDVVHALHLETVLLLLEFGSKYNAYISRETTKHCCVSLINIMLGASARIAFGDDESERWELHKKLETAGH